MKENVLARRYARALFEIARERKILDKVHGDMNSLQANLAANQELRMVVDSQDVSKHEKQQVFGTLLKGKVSDVFLNFLFLLCKKNREILIDTISREFDALMDKYNRKLRAATVTAIPLDSEVLTRLKELLDDTYDADVKIDNMTDPGILGGIVIEVGGQVFDGSLASQLRRLKSQLRENTNSLANP